MDINSYYEIAGKERHKNKQEYPASFLGMNKERNTQSSYIAMFLYLLSSYKMSLLFPLLPSFLTCFCFLVSSLHLWMHIGYIMVEVCNYVTHTYVCFATVYIVGDEFCSALCLL